MLGQSETVRTGSGTQVTGNPTSQALVPILASDLADTAEWKPPPVRFANSLFLCFLFVFKMVLSHASHANLATRLPEFDYLRYEKPENTRLFFLLRLAASLSIRAASGCADRRNG